MKVPHRIRLMPATRAPNTRKPEKKRARNTAFPPVPIEERFGTCQPLGADQDVAPPTQDEPAPPFAPDPVADLVPDNGTQDAEHDGIPQVKMSLLDQDAGGKEYGL